MTLYRDRFLVAVFICLLSIISSGQSTRFTHLTTEDGLSQNSVVDITQDHHGFMWIATQDGLNRYDGTTFQTFPHYFRDVTRADYSQLGKLYPDENHNIWFTSLEGHLMKFNQRTENVSTVIDHLDISTILLSDTDTLIGTYGQGIWKLENGKATEQALENNHIYSITHFDSKYYLGTDNGLWIREQSDLVWKEFSPELRNIPISGFHEGPSRKIISTYGRGLFELSNEGHIEQFDNLPLDLNIQDVTIDEKDNIWIATYGNGIYKLSRLNIVSQYLHNPQDKFSINYNDILSLEVDKHGNIWIGTDGGGLSIWNANINRIGGISKGQSIEDYPVDVARAMTTDNDDRLWIGTSGKGLTALDKNRKPIHHFSSRTQDQNRIVSLLDQGPNLLVGTQGAGLRTFDYDQLKFTKEELPDLTIWDIHQLPQSDKVLVATRAHGVLIGTSGSNNWKPIILDEKNSANNNVRVISNYKNDEVIIGTEQGHVWILDLRSGNHRQLKLENRSPGSIKAIYYQEDSETLWIGTQRAGILVYNLINNEQAAINRSNGLPNNTVYSILPDNQNNLWISTNKGLMEIQITSYWEDKSYKITNQLTTKNGLYNNEFNTGASYVDQKGMLYFGGIDGVNWIKPDDFNFQSSPTSEVSIIRLNTFERGQRKTYNISDIYSISLTHQERNFDLRFGTINFGNEGSYQYRLEGIQDNWTDNGINNIAHFTNIPPGDYRFEVRWMPKGYSRTDPASTTLDIHIKNPWWSTPFARIMWLGVLAGVLYSIYKIRTNIIRRETRQKYEFEKQVGEMELQLLRTQMNPHFMFNSLNAIKNYILKSEPRLASEYLSNFAHLIRMILQNSREKTISLDEELETLLLYIELEQLRFKEGFQFTSEIESNIHLSSIQVPPMILQPYIENAIWHGLLHKDGERHLSLDIRRGIGIIKIEITDNGIGIEAAQEQRSKSATRYKSMGMGITKSRIDITNRLNNMGIEVQINDLTDPATDTSGTQVLLQFPIQDHYKSA